MKKLPLLLLLSLSYLGISQEKIPYNNGEELLQLSIEASNAGDYEKTLEILEQVNSKDSIYCTSLISKSYYLLNLERYDESIAAADEGLSLDCDTANLSYYINKGASYLNKEDYVVALEVFEEALEAFPKNAQLWYNKGVALEETGNIPEAVSSYQNAILFQPSYARPHLKLGDIAYQQELTSQAVMSYNMYLLLDPDGADSFRILKGLNDLVTIKNPNSADGKLSISADEDSFEQLDLILDNKLALNEQYEVNNKIDIPLTKQNHLLLEQLSSYEETEGFWARVYVPLFQWIWENGAFDEFTYTISFSIENEQYKEIVVKNVEEVKAFLGELSGKWLQLLEEPGFRVNAEDEGLHYYYAEAVINGIGRNPNGISVGDWRFFNTHGQLSGIGSYMENGDRTGDWVWYYPSGTIKETAGYRNGKLEGENKAYFSNGKLQYVTYFENDEINGEYLLYNEKGALLQKKYYKNGVLEGPYQSYFQVGEVLPEFDIDYRNGEVENTAFEYYADGTVYAEMQFKGGVQDGLEKIFNQDGSLYSETLYKEGLATGEYKTYYPDGKLMEKSQYKEGDYHGAFEVYYRNGNLQSRGSREEGVLEGIYQGFDRDGKLHYEYDYKEGEIIGYRFYTKTGEILDQGKRKGGEFYYKGYSALGQVINEGNYNVSGGRTGEWKFYSENGVLTGEGIYKEDKANGPYTEYYETGEKLSEATYKMDTLVGYYVDYHKNGQMRSQGWYKDGAQDGEWRSYYIDGTLEAKYYFHKGKLHNVQEFYGVDGSLTSLFEYHYGDPVIETIFNPEGEIFEQVNYGEINPGGYNLKEHYFNGNVNTAVDFVNGFMHGSYVQYNSAGNKLVEGQYINGEEHGLWKYYSEDGELERTLNYLNGQLHGEMIGYFADGRVEDKYSYEFGGYSGTWLSYHDNGNLDVVTEHFDGEEHGRKEFYDKEGRFQLVRFYDNGRIIGYSYHDENGKELPMIALENGTGKIKALYDNGKVSREMEYVNGVMSGVYRSYYYSGELQNEIEYKSGDYHGRYAEYYPNGALKTEKQYLFDALHGVAKEYYQNGELKEVTHYLNDLRNGESVEYGDFGEPIKKVTYFNDNIYNEENI